MRQYISLSLLEWQDGNLGLVHRLREAVYRHSMQRLTQTFMTLSLTDVSSRVNLRSSAEAELYIRNMVQKLFDRVCVFGSSDPQIEQEEVHASMDQTAGMVSFSESPEGYDSHNMAAYLQSQVYII